MRERLSRRGLWEGHMIANAFCPGDSAKHGLPEGKEVHRVGRGTEGKSPPPASPTLYSYTPNLFLMKNCFSLMSLTTVQQEMKPKEQKKPEE